MPIQIELEYRTVQCRHCHSTDVSKVGFHKNIQYYICNVCKKKSSGTDSYPQMRYPKELIYRGITLYYNGASYGAIANTFDDVVGKRPSKSTLFNWIHKYTSLVSDYIDTLRPQVGEYWQADETVIDMGKKQVWFWDLIDSETRYLLSSHMSKTRTMEDCIKFLRRARDRTNTWPQEIRTDKMMAYPGAFNKVFWKTPKEFRVEHTRSHGMRDEATNINLIERFHGSVKQRTKVMRDLKDFDTAWTILDGFVINYNFLHEHSALGVVPAKAAGILPVGLKN